MNSQKILILSAQEAVSADKLSKFNIISIGSEKDGWPTFQNALDVQKLNFTDLDCRCLSQQNELVKRGYKFPSLSEVGKGIEFARKHKNQPLIIHCTAGVSRSSGLTFCILYDRLKNVRLAITELYNIKKTILPNDLVIKLGFEYLGENLEEKFNELENIDVWHNHHKIDNIILFK